VVTPLIWSGLSHVFMHCPVVQPAVVWLQDLWARLVPGSQLPLDARVLLAGDHTVWDPGGAAAGVSGAVSGPICDCSSAERFGTCGAVGWPMVGFSRLLQWLR
jgi:hypothetical protein